MPWASSDRVRKINSSAYEAQKTCFAKNGMECVKEPHKPAKARTLFGKKQALDLT